MQTIFEYKSHVFIFDTGSYIFKERKRDSLFIYCWLIAQSTAQGHLRAFHKREREKQRQRQRECSQTLAK